MVGIAPLDSTLGARVTDVALGDMSDGEWCEVEDAFHEYGALVFPAQHLSDDEHIAFGERFGDIEILRDGAKAVRVSNKRDDGSLMKRIGLFRILKLNDRWLPAIVTVEPADGRSRTVVEGVGFDSDLHLTAADFTADAVIQSVRTAN